MAAENSKTGLIVSIFMEPSQKEGDSVTVREVYWGSAKESPIPKDNIKFGKTGDHATVEFLVLDVGGEVIRQKNFNMH